MGVRGTNPSAITWGEIEKRDGGLGAPGEQLEVVSGEMAPHACSLSGAQPQLTASKSVLVLPASSKTKPQQQVPQPALTLSVSADPAGSQSSVTGFPGHAVCAWQLAELGIWCNRVLLSLNSL